jgi:hypothetical protein
MISSSRRFMSANPSSSSTTRCSIVSSDTSAPSDRLRAEPVCSAPNTCSRLRRGCDSHAASSTAVPSAGGPPSTGPLPAGNTSHSACQKPASWSAVQVSPPPCRVEGQPGSHAGLGGSVPPGSGHRGVAGRLAGVLSAARIESDRSRRGDRAVPRDCEGPATAVAASSRRGGDRARGRAATAQTLRRTT